MINIFADCYLVCFNFVRGFGWGFFSSLFSLSSQRLDGLLFTYSFGVGRRFSFFDQFQLLHSISIETLFNRNFTQILHIHAKYNVLKKPNYHLSIIAICGPKLLLKWACGISLGIAVNLRQFCMAHAFIISSSNAGSDCATNEQQTV